MSFNSLRYVFGMFERNGELYFDSSIREPELELVQTIEALQIAADEAIRDGDIDGQGLLAWYLALLMIAQQGIQE